MAKVNYKAVLSLTEPNHQIFLRFRQDDTQTQTLSVEVTANGKLFPFVGYTVEFVNITRSDSGQPIIEKVDSISPENARIEFTLGARSLQWLGKNVAYFSFKDSTGNEVFSTHNFEYEVVHGVHKEPILDSGYLWQVDEIIEKIKIYFAENKADWEKFIEENKAILESIDPGGTILAKVNEYGEKLAEHDKKLEELADNLMDTTIDIGGGEPREIFSEEIARIADTIEETEFNIGFLTDNHFDYGHTQNSWDAYAHYNITHLNNIQALQDKLDCFVYGGDNNSSSCMTIPQAKQLLKEWALKALLGTKKDSFILPGNHDDGGLRFVYNRQVAADTQDVFKIYPGEFVTENEFKKIYATKEKLFGEVRDNGSLYFYKDYPDKKIRVIGLDAIDVDTSILNSDGSCKYRTIHHMGYSGKQLSWLANTALKNVPVDYHTIVFSHTALYFGTGADKNPATKGDMYMNHDVLREILNGFKNGTPVNATGMFTDLPVTISTDYSEQGQRKLVGFFCGHSHREENENIGFQVIQCKASTPESKEQINTSNEDAWYVISINTETNTVTLKGFGRATDRTFNY